MTHEALKPHRFEPGNDNLVDLEKVTESMSPLGASLFKGIVQATREEFKK